MRPSRWMVLPLVAAVVLALAGCSADGEGDAAPTTVPLEVVRIGVLTGTGDTAADVRRAVEAAAQEANRQGRVVGWQVEVVARSASDAAAASETARELAGDDRLAGAVVSLDDEPLRAALSELEKERVLAVSPDAVAGSLTRGDDLRPERAFTVFHRIAPHTRSLGGAAGQFALQELNAKTAAVVTDGDPDSESMTSSFARQIERAGSSVELTTTVAADGTDAQRAAGQVAAGDADAVFVGASRAAFDAFLGHAASAGLTVPIITAAPIAPDAPFTTESTDAMRVFAAAPAGLGAGDAEALEAAWEQTEATDPPGAAAARAFDAANVVIDAIAAALQDRRELAPEIRPTVVNAAGRVTFEGAAGNVGFDDFGDQLHQMVTIYRLSGDRWQAVATQRFLPNQ